MLLKMVNKKRCLSWLLDWDHVTWDYNLLYLNIAGKRDLFFIASLLPLMKYAVIFGGCW